MKFFWWICTGALVFCCDRLTKLMVLNHLHGAQVINILPGFDLRLAFNHGVAFSLFFETGLHSPWLLIIASMALSLVLIWMLLRTPVDASMQQLALIFILAGAMGNIADRIYYGAVIDFLDVYYQHYHWPAFNLADAFICIGAILLFSTSRSTSEH